MEELYRTSEELTDITELRFRRDLLSTMNWEMRLAELSGARGTGKTTLMLQKAKLLNEKNKGSAIYISLDSPYFFNNTVFDVADEFVKYGGENLFIDEVHKYPEKFKNYDWSAELKSIYDKYPKLKVVYSGSSILQLYKGNGDLSRRRTIYRLPGLSFREYLEYNEVFSFNKVGFSDILDNHQEVAKEITGKIKVIPHFRKYLTSGYYPFYNEAPEQYHSRLNEVISVILETDVPTIADITYETIVKLKKLLSVIATSVPYVPNLSKVRNDLYIADQRTLLRYMTYLEKSGLIHILSKGARGNILMRKPDKLFLNNPNLIRSFNTNPEIGTVRETFFMNQLEVVADVKYPEKGDFLINNEYVFEVGGKNKKKEQLKDVENGFYAIDDIEVGFGKTIPLWLFGFMY